MSGNIVYLMRGLPSCGKSHTARRLAGAEGLVCETDEFFHTQVGDDPTRYDYNRELAAEARRWNFERFCAAVSQGISPIVVDRGNSLAAETQKYARFAIAAGYDVRLAEPDSPWWQEIRVLLKYKDVTRPILLEWADRLATMSRSTHRVPVAEIRRRMAKWKHDLSVEEILDYVPQDERETKESTASPLLPVSAHAKTVADRRDGKISEEHREEGALSDSDGAPTSTSAQTGPPDDPATYGIIEWGFKN